MERQLPSESGLDIYVCLRTQLRTSSAKAFHRGVQLIISCAYDDGQEVYDCRVTYERHVNQTDLGTKVDAEDLDGDQCAQIGNQQQSEGVSIESDGSSRRKNRSWISDVHVGKWEYMFDDNESLSNPNQQ